MQFTGVWSCFTTIPTKQEAFILTYFNLVLINRGLMISLFNVRYLAIFYWLSLRKCT